MKAAQVIAWNLRRLRVAKRLSQESLAVDAGVDVSYVSRIENAKENPSITLLERLAVALDSDFFELVKRPTKGQGAPKTLKPGRKSR
jgi:transcriptional regulator with XRE-family HTH domain